MPGGLGYDEQGSLATYFALTFLSLAIIPSTLWSLRSTDKSQKKAINELPVPEKRRKAQKARLFGRAKAKGRAVSRRTLLLLAGWIVFAGLAYKVATSEAVQTAVYNPFEILGISESLTDKEIKRAYKKLSLKFHPDKIRLGPNETREDVDNKFVELTKAYKSLTDEAVRENLKLYGNPDGPSQREDVVAIPKWIVEGSNGGWVLAVYGLVFGGLMPWFVGKWWFGTRGHTKEGVLNSTATTFFRRLDEDASYADLISLLASASEFATSAAELAGSDAPKVKKEAKAELGRREEILKAKARELGLGEGGGLEVMGGSFESAGARKVGMLIWSHLLRVEWDEPSSREELGALLARLPPLLTSLLTISLAHNWLLASSRIMRLHAFLAQATLPGLPPLLQLPHITPAAARALEGRLRVLAGKDGSERWVEAFLALGEDRRRRLVDECCEAEVGETELREMVDVAESWPKLELLEAGFKVVGEKIITPQAIVQVVLKVQLNTLGALVSGSADGRPARTREVSVGKVANEPDAEDEDDETDAEKKAKLDRLSKKAPVLAHTPYWPEDRPLRFWAMVVDIKSEKVIVQPVVVPTLHPGEHETFNLQFQAPAGPGLYTFQVVIISNSIACGEVRQGLMLRVDEPVVEVDAAADDDDISEPEEDSLAGQLAAMKGEKVKSKRSTADDDDESSEDESSSDEEGPKGKKNDDDSSDDSDSD